MPLTNISNEDFNKLVKFIHTQYGIDLSQKRQLVTSRLSSLLSQKGYTDFGPFVSELLRKQDPADLELVRRAVEGGAVTPQEAVRLQPSREQFEVCWRTLEHRLRQGKAEEDALPYLRQLAGRMGGCDGFLRAALALEVFRERGLISMTEQEDRLSLCLIPVQGKADLMACPYLARLRNNPTRGGNSQ